MPHIPGPPKPDPVEVIEVGEAPVPFLRPFDWVATALRSFRERPLPGTYITQASPGFDLFGTSRVPEMTAELTQGVLGGVEVFGARVARTKWRQYISVAVSHDDPVSRIMTLTRIIQDDILGFPVLPWAVSDRALPANVFLTGRMASVPPDGRIAASVPGIGVGNQLSLRSLFIEYDVGEPSGDIS